MNYLLLLYRDEKTFLARTPQDIQATGEKHRPYIEMLKSGDHYVSGERLVAAGSATTLRAVDGKVVSTDGPFAEAKEQLGGFYLLKAKDLDEAIALAKQMPGFERLAGCEIRPLMPSI